ncbi:FAD binding domain-containing protein [Williamsia sp.]|uniref:FAD binding domain-containing protein n=1 Tax=Williamsia sp. TaxID=1872085 RepID=UPI002F94C795
MKFPPFDYVRAESVAEAIDALSQSGSDVKILAGGQSLLQLLGRRAVRPAVIVDINRVAELDYIERRDGQIVTGALTRYSAAEHSRLLADELPLVPKAIDYVGHTTIRNRGTLGGSISFGDPAGEFPCAAVNLDADVVITSFAGMRVVKAEELYTGPYATVLQATEMVTEIRFPLPPASAHWAVAEFSRRHRDYAVIASEVGIGLDSNGVMDYARIAVAGASDRVRRFRSAEQALIGQYPDEAAMRAAAEAVFVAADPIADVHAPSDFRRELARTMTFRAIKTAVESAKASNPT